MRMPFLYCPRTLVRMRNWTRLLWLLQVNARDGGGYKVLPGRLENF